MKLSFKIKLTQSQQEAYDLVHNDKIKYLTLNYSRQSGKSTLMKVLVIEWLFQSNQKIGYVCRNYLLAKRFFKDIVSYLPKQYIKSANASDLTIELITNSTLQFFSAESGDSLRGMTFNYLICDEFAFFNNGENFYNEVLFPTIKVKGRKVIFVSTPCGKNNIFHTMYLRGINNRTFANYASLKKDIYQDGLVSKEEIEDIKNQIPPLAFKQEFMVEFLDSSLTFFQGFENCFTTYQYNTQEYQYMGIDLSTVGEDDTIVTLINESNQTKQYNIKGTLDQKYKQIADLINTTQNLQKVYIEKNGVGSPMINEIQKLVYNKNIIEEWLTTNESKNEILGNLALTISKSEIYFHNDNKQLFSELSTFIYKYTKRGNLQLEAASGNHDDFVLSLAIALEAKRNGLLSGQYNIKFHRKYR